MGKKKNKERIKVEGLGSSISQVTGSCFSIEYPTKNGTNSILIELGMAQGSKTLLDDYNINQRIVESIEFEKYKAIFMLHIHCDHIGLMPSAMCNNFKGRFIGTYENKLLSERMLLDSAFIIDKNVNYFKSKQGMIKQHLYTDQDVYLMMNRFDIYSKHEIHKLDDNLSFRFINNGHTVGSVQLELFFTLPSSKIRKLLVTSDLGNSINCKLQPFVTDNEICKTANAVLIESTYGSSDRGFNKKMAVEERRDLIKRVRRITRNRHKVLIPCFSYNRCQSMLCFLYDNFKDDEKFRDTMVIIDSKLTQEINNVYRNILTGEDLEYWNEVLRWRNLKQLKEYKESEEYMNKKDTPMVVLSSSGMISAGRSVTWTERILENKNDAILFIGYCSENTIGNKVQNPKFRTVEIGNKEYEKKCEIKKYSSFTSHAQQSDLIQYMKQINCQDIYLHHGDKSAKLELKEKGKEELYKIGKTTKIHIIDEENNTFYI